MEAEKASYPVAAMARVLGVSRQGFYAWCKRSQGRACRQRARDVLDGRVAQVFRDSRRTYGCRRVAASLRRQGIRVGVKTVAASMRRQGLVAVCARSIFKHPRRPSSALRLKDACGRVWDTGQLDRVWITDFTYLRCGEGWVYLIAVRDAHSRRVLSHVMDTVMTSDMVIRAVKSAIKVRGRIPRRIVLHADQGSQFTAKQVTDFMTSIGGCVSAGRTGVCWDNAMAESFWATLKSEHYYRYAFATRSEVQASVSEWIDVFYNHQRLHSALGNKSPVEYELQQQTRGHKAA